MKEIEIDDVTTQSLRDKIKQLEDVLKIKQLELDTNISNKL